MEWNQKYKDKCIQYSKEVFKWGSEITSSIATKNE